jgi:hypothetical protein
MLFERRLQEGLLDGSIQVAFRRWKRPQVSAGRRYRSPIGMVEVDRVAVVEATGIGEDDARAAGYASPDELIRELKGPTDATLYRIELRKSPDADPRSALAEQTELNRAQFEELTSLLARQDAGLGRPWTLATLEAIEAQPGVRAADLMLPLGWGDLHQFKLHVRKLKGLGLTLSLMVGYRLSPRGEAYLRLFRHGRRAQQVCNSRACRTPPPRSGPPPSS